LIINIAFELFGQFDLEARRQSAAKVCEFRIIQCKSNRSAPPRFT